MDTNTQISSKSRIMLVVGIVVLVIIGGALVTVMKSGKNSAQGSTSAGLPEGGTRVIPTIDVSKPAVVISPVEAKQGYSVGQEFSVKINGNSQGADIAGYDLLFGYNPEAYDILEVKSLIPSFQIFSTPRPKESYLSVTGIKLLSAKGVTAFSPDKPMLEVKIRGKKPGKFYLDVLPTKGKETSKFVDSKVNVITPQFQPIEFTIQ
jgi:hypothetical protein